MTVTYLANEGVLLSSGGRRVLIDALFERYGPEYAVPPDSTQRALALAQSPFDSIDLILVTHRHGDHFHPAPVNRHLDANPHTTLLTSRQVIDSLHRPLTSATSRNARILARTTAPRARQRVVVAGIPVHLLGLPHSGGGRQRHVEHLGFIVELGGRRVLHVGDAELTEATLAPFRLDTARVDMALLPFWALQDRETRRVIERWIRPRQIVAFHLPEGRAARIARELETVLPSVVTFGRSLDTHRW
ncbi:MAG TPA: MBL fold metallo-hydrolase [Gemmatimonadaceae bacterium]|nr:MBL fold metallo-hydrolase [Gemmatimonadaceae bacterium]